LGILNHPPRQPDRPACSCSYSYSYSYSCSPSFFVPSGSKSEDGEREDE
jgi:hypothetical protein